MKNFNEIKHQWEERLTPAPPNAGFNEIINKSKYLYKKQIIGQIVLSTTVVILILYFFYIAAYRDNDVFTGLGIMIGSLLVRIIIEHFYMIKREGFPPDLDVKQYTAKLIKYYKTRKYIHYLITPILFGSYILGFLMLLPAFKQYLSSGFYTYIIFSSWAVFIALAILIIVQIKKELKILKNLVGE